MSEIFKPLQLVNRGAERVLKLGVVALMAVLVTILSLQVIGRYIFGASPVWMVESAQYLFVWLSLSATSLAYRQAAHPSLDYLWERARSGLRIAQRIGVHAAVLALGVAIALGGGDLLENFSAQLMPGMRLSMAWVYASPLIAGALLVLFALEFLAADLGLASRPGGSGTEHV
jgi:TRAP-type C4-dicarboxylate transport system permease small subunit